MRFGGGGGDGDNDGNDGDCGNSSVGIERSANESSLLKQDKLQTSMNQCFNVSDPSAKGEELTHGHKYITRKPLFGSHYSEKKNDDQLSLAAYNFRSIEEVVFALMACHYTEKNEHLINFTPVTTDWIYKVGEGRKEQQQQPEDLGGGLGAFAGALLCVPGNIFLASSSKLPPLDPKSLLDILVLMFH
ncbi:hypothetical protein Aperf_G00000112386 [Anoplocephala perfoliata]